MTTRRYPRPAIFDRLPEGRFAAIEASAGTGKTFTLEHLFVDKIIAGARVDEVLVVTFTEKATREMTRRVRETLSRIVRMEKEASEEEPAWLIDDVARARLTDALVGFERAPISTIHGFCQRILSDHAFRSKRPFGHELVEPRRAFGAAFRDELRSLLAEESTERRVLFGVLEDLDVDRLESLLYRWHHERGRVHPAWDESRFAEALRRVNESPLVDLAKGGVRRSDVLQRVTKELDALQKLARKHAGGDVLEGLLAIDRWGRRQVVQNERARLWVPARLQEAPVAQALVLDLLSVAPPLFGVLVHRLVPRVAERLRVQKAERFQLDFDDMLSLVAKALHDPNAGPFVEALRAQYKHALVDEFQDTDDIQWSIFRKLFIDEGATGTLTIIGDPKQAIYGFRNADVHTYYEARDVLTRTAGVVHLEECYRSTARLIETYNHIFTGADEGEGFFQGTVRYDHPVRAGDPSRRLLNEEGHDAPSLILWQPAGEEQPAAADMRRALGARIALEARNIAGGSLRMHIDGESRPIRYSDMHVLVRNAHEATSIAAEFTNAGVPFAFFKQDGLFETDEAHALLEVLQAVADPSDGAARLRAWLSDFFEVPLEDVEACRSADAQNPLVARLHSWHRRAERRETGLLRAILVESGLVRRLLYRPHGARALTNYEHLVEILIEERGASADIHESIALLEAFIEGRAEPVRGGTVQRAAGEADAVQLLTMHKAKGLEAPVVFLAGGFTRSGSRSPYEPVVAYATGDGVRVREAWLPPLPAEAVVRAEEEAREEDERLLYVAITRAKGRLYAPYFGAPPASHAALLGARRRYGPLQGPYRWLDTRLEQLALAGFIDGNKVEYEVLPIELHVEPTPAPVAAPPQPATGPVPDFDALRLAHAGFTITSYTRIKASADAGYIPPPTAMDDAKPEEFAGEERPMESEVESESATTLPGGAGMGIFLHEVLEHLDFARLGELPEEEWIEESTPWLEQSARRQGIDDVHVRPAASLLWRALRAPIELGDEAFPEGLASIETKSAEMEIFYPIPEADHPPLGQLAPHPIRRGVIRGIVDLVFEHDGKTYFLDWKSDRVPLDGSGLADHVATNYGLQARLYTLGVVRMLGLSDEVAYEAKFGGLVYAFLRAGASGIVFDRPTWSEVLAWDEELRYAERPFGYDLV